MKAKYLQLNRHYFVRHAFQNCTQIIYLCFMNKNYLKSECALLGPKNELKYSMYKLSNENMKLLRKNDQKKLKQKTILDTILLDLKVKYLQKLLFCADSHNLKFSRLKVFCSPLIMTRDVFYCDFAKNCLTLYELSDDKFTNQQLNQKVQQRKESFFQQGRTM